jgi:DNA-binding transcriptional LysR family regulator
MAATAKHVSQSAITNAVFALEETPGTRLFARSEGDYARRGVVYGARLFLPELMARFRATYPDLEIDLHDLDRESTERAVLAGDVDLEVVLLSNVENIRRFRHHVLIRSRQQLWTSPTHPLAQLNAPSLADIVSYPYILVTVDEGEQSMLRYWKQNDVEPNIAFRTSSMEALRGLVADRFGVTMSIRHGVSPVVAGRQAD